MVKIEIDIKKEELDALDALYQDAKCPIKMGMILGLFRTKLQAAIIDKANKARKEEIKTEALALAKKKKVNKNETIETD